MAWIFYLKNFKVHFYIYMCEYKFEFINQRRKLILLAAPHLASNKVNFAINRALLTV